ncbi:MAG: S53 family peptidase, partial [Thermoplasmata archaeon]
AMIMTVYSMPSYGNHAGNNIQNPGSKMTTDMQTYQIGIVVENNQNLVKYYLDRMGIPFTMEGKILSFYTGYDSLHEIYSFINSTGNAYYQLDNQLNFTPYLSINSFQSANPFVYYPQDIYDAYDYNWAFNHGITGKGETIAIVDAFGDPSIGYDINAFDQLTGLPAVNLSVIYMNKSSTPFNSHWASETSLDVEWAHASAPLANIDLILAQNSQVGNLSSAISYTIDSIHPDIISLSWGIAENQLTKQYVYAMDQIFYNATKEGITVVAASGDEGAYDGTSSLSVNFPASSPYVLGVGGTSLYVKNGNYSQDGWGLSGTPPDKSIGSGGGFSSDFKRPSWQDPANYNSSERGVPDVSMIANPNTGVLMISQAQPYDAGGTSLAAPLWAGVVALMDQNAGHDLGLVNPIFYQISNTPFYNYSFDQITSGYNGYYTAGYGWNPVTGLGTPHVSNLINISKEVTGNYGSIAVSNYYSGSVNATIEISNSNDTYSFVSLYENSTNFVKAGIFNGTVLSYLVMVDENGTIFEYNETIARYAKYRVGLQEYNSTYNFMLNGQTLLKKEFYLTYIGNMSPAFGTEVIGSYNNLTSVSSSFSGIYSGNQSINNFTIRQIHFQSINYSRYDSINIEKTGENFTAERGFNYSTYLNYRPNNTYITYKISYSQDPQITLSLSNGYAKNFYVNGKKSASSFYVSPGDKYLVNTTLSGENISIKISVPEIYSLTLSDSGTSIPTGLSAVANYFYTFSNDSYRITVPVLNGSNNIKIYSRHFYEYSGTYIESGNGSKTFKMLPYDANLTVMVYPSNVSVNLSGESFNFSMGYYYGAFAPGNYVLNINKSGFYNYSDENIILKPGLNYQKQITLTNRSAFYKITGKVKDGIFNFSLQYVRVNNTQLESYTNSTGDFVLFLTNRTSEITFSRPFYSNLSVNYSIDQGLSMNIEMYPANISISNIFYPVITNVLPFLFSVAYISWKPYSGDNFYEYQIMYSTNPSMSNPKIVTISSQSTTDAFIVGITPGSNYYVQEIVHLSTGQYFQSKKVLISYSNPVYLVLNLVIVIGILIYVYMAFKVFRKKKTDYEIP